MAKYIISFRAQLIHEGKIIGGAGAGYFYQYYPDPLNVNWHTSIVNVDIYVVNDLLLYTSDIYMREELITNSTNEGQAVNIIKSLAKQHLKIDVEVKIQVETYLLEKTDRTKHVYVYKNHEMKTQRIRQSIGNNDYTEHDVPFSDSLASISSTYLT